MEDQKEKQLIESMERFISSSEATVNHLIKENAELKEKVNKLNGTKIYYILSLCILALGLLAAILL